MNNEHLPEHLPDMILDDEPPKTSPQHDDESHIYRRLKLAKYEKGTSTMLPPYKVQFTSDISYSGYEETDEKPVVLDLLQLTPELEETLKLGQILEFRAGGEEDEVRLVTSDQSFQVSRVGYSNMLMMCEGVSDRNDTQIHEDCGEIEPKEASCFGIAQQYLEILPDRPSVKCLFENVPIYPDFVEFDRLKEVVRCSDAELSGMVKEYNFFQVEDAVFTIAAQDEIEFIKILMQTYEFESFEENGFELQAIQQLLCPEDADDNEKLIPEFILQGLIQLYRVDVEAGAGLVKIDIEKITTRVLQLLLKIAENKISVQDLLTTFMHESIGGEYLKPIFKTESIEEVSLDSAGKKTVVHVYSKSSVEEVKNCLQFCSLSMDDGPRSSYLKFIDISLLDDNPKIRFDEVFGIKSRWSEEDLAKVFKQIIHKELKLSALTIKYCRRITGKSGKTLFVLKNTA